MGKEKSGSYISALAVLILVIVAGFVLIEYSNGINSYGNREPIRVGVLHSLTGSMAISERSVVDATVLALNEINASGGLRGRSIEILLRDGASDEQVFAEQARSLIVEDRVDVIFGCWTSASRKSVKAVVEEYNHLLFYPVQYEGLEISPNIVYTGSAPNQQIIPAVSWAMKTKGPIQFLVGSDYVFPHAAHEIIKNQLRALNGTVAGEAFIPIGSTDVQGIVEQIVQKKPDLVINTLNGDSNIAFFRELRDRGIASDQIPTLSFSLSESEYQVMGPDLLMGDYVAWTYLQSVQNPENQAFVQRFKEVYGDDRVISDPMISAYIGVNFWKEAVELVKNTRPDVVRAGLGGLSMASPKGPVSIDSYTQHVWNMVYIGRFSHGGQMDIIWDSQKPIRPVPYPPFRQRSYWDNLLDSLYTGWGNRWSSPPEEGVGL